MYFSPNNFLLNSRPPPVEASFSPQKMALDCGREIVQSVVYKSQTQTSPVVWLVHGQAKWARKWGRKKNPTDKYRRANRRTCAQHGSWQTRAQKVNIEQKEDRDQLFPSQRPNSKRRFSGEELNKGSPPATSQRYTGPPSTNEHTCLQQHDWYGRGPWPLQGAQVTIVSDTSWRNSTCRP